MSSPDGGVAATANTMRVIQLAMAGGIAMLALVVGYIYETSQAQPTPQALGTLKTLSMVAGFYAVLVPFIAPILRKNILTPAPTLAKIQSARLVTAALGEGASMLGLVACFLGAQSGALRERPVFWLDAAPAAIFILWALKTLPTEEDLRAQVPQP